MFLSYSSACVHERSDSWNQKEWICDTPCRKNWRASSDEVVTGKFFVTPMPGRSLAGSSGCAPGGTMHMSGCGADACLPLAAMWAEENAARSRMKLILERRCMDFMRPSIGEAGTLRGHRSACPKMRRGT